ncbi:MAG: indole-3-glycerol-phosphate synthase [Candidatus Nitrosotenuis sp.]|uniref:indole-3-glycerol-phosphate synthase n=1 Tax=Candidatus Nitrosotenuis uzonensis TaxID=1407055 RepID=A0A812F2Y9_9ARCH|nr:indole-3-glycerol-phosphate synthase [Candidatus Nitrosotenuis uzonensis]MCA2003385.1 indole-3-glycerol-phosphate synthase [Candidatus Nitrosotenuis sp.]CAE6498922.1 Indole-3-glycerol-phosphate synthase [Candidatus Nitrosotenuis uzonensis]
MENSHKAISDGTYEIVESLQQSPFDLIESIRANKRASLITEVKFSSPSLGQIRSMSDPVEIAKSMVRGGALGLSVLTQPYLFEGSPKYFMEIRKQLRIPMLMKDIIVDKIQIDAAKRIGADYMLLIQSLFDSGHLKEIDEFVEYGHKQGLKVLVESHTKEEFANSLKTDADIIGINNRNLDTLKIDINVTKNILEGHKKDRVVISESGIETPEDIIFLRKCGADAFLVGSSIMKSHDVEQSVRRLANAI